MIKLLILADDLTGALDTGIQFESETAIVVLYSTDLNESEIKMLPEKVEVLIVDTESRHLKPWKAYDRIFRLLQTAKDLHIPYVYKKTDSGMRGNIGSELEACAKVYENKNIHFIPAFPQMNRITVNGIQYIDGVPVAESVFGKDPFEPVKCSSVKEIIGLQSNIACLIKDRVEPEADERMVFIYDCRSREELEMIANDLKKCEDARLFAGCAGFASVLYEMLDLKKPEFTKVKLKEKLLIICGSVNPVTLKQLDKAEKDGALRICLTNQQKLEEDYFDSEDGKMFISDIKGKLEAVSCVIVESVTDMGSEKGISYDSLNDIKKEKIRHKIANNLGTILKKLLEQGVESTLFVTGGDTLISFMTNIGMNQLSPICELFPGVVLSKIKYGEKTFDLISKSGGFGDERLFSNIQKMIKK